VAIFYPEPSRTFGEFLLLPNLTTRDCVPERVDLRSRLVPRSDEAEGPPELSLRIPIASAMMQSVTDDRLAIELARCGGIGFIYGSQSVADQAQMVRHVKAHKAGFVVSTANLRPDATIADVVDCTAATGHSTIAITDDGSANGRFLGVITRRDYRIGHTDPTTRASALMTPADAIPSAIPPVTLAEANETIWRHKLHCLPVLDRNGRLLHLVFRKDHDAHIAYPLEAVDREKRLIVGAAINTRDYMERLPALVEAGVDVVCIDSSDGYSEWQAEVLAFARSRYGERFPIGAGNVVDASGFRYLVEAGASFVKVGIGGGSICITREQKGIGRGQATALLDVVAERNRFLSETGKYVPVCSDGGISQDYHITIALALGADFVMLGRYFARFDEAPGRKLNIRNQTVKEYWGEGSNRARNTARYEHTASTGGQTLLFEEGVDGHVPYAGAMRQGLDVTLGKIRSTLSSCGSKSIDEFREKARLTIASTVSLREGGVHDVLQKEGPTTDAAD
jgi:IMP dehydrogenase